MFACRCGTTLHFGTVPCEVEWKLISDVEFDRFAGMVDAEDVYSAMVSALRCSTCHRLWIFWDGFGNAPEELVSQAPASQAIDRGAT